MKILGISGSPRKGSNTSILVKRALNVCEKEGFETEFISLANFKIEFCDDCGYCNEKNNFKCSKEDDVEKILESMNVEHVWIRVNTLKIDVDKCIKLLEEQGLEVDVDKDIPFLVKVVKSRRPVHYVECIRNGFAIIQDKASI